MHECHPSLTRAWLEKMLALLLLSRQSESFWKDSQMNHEPGGWPRNQASLSVYPTSLRAAIKPRLHMRLSTRLWMRFRVRDTLFPTPHGCFVVKHRVDSIFINYLKALFYSIRANFVGALGDQALVRRRPGSVLYAKYILPTFWREMYRWGIVRISGIIIFHLRSYVKPHSPYCVP